MPEKSNLGQIEALELVNVATPVLPIGEWLAAGAAHFGEVFYVGGYTHISGYVYSGEDSASNGLVIEQAQTSALLPDLTLTTVGTTRSRRSISGADIDGNAFSVQIVAPFARVVYTNGVTGTAAFHMFFSARIIRGL